MLASETELLLLRMRHTEMLREAERARLVRMAAGMRSRSMPLQHRLARRLARVVTRWRQLFRRDTRATTCCPAGVS